VWPFEIVPLFLCCALFSTSDRCEVSGGSLFSFFPSFSFKAFFPEFPPLLLLDVFFSAFRISALLSLPHFFSFFRPKVLQDFQGRLLSEPPLLFPGGPRSYSEFSVSFRIHQATKPPPPFPGDETDSPFLPSPKAPKRQQSPSAPPSSGFPRRPLFESKFLLRWFLKQHSAPLSSHLLPVNRRPDEQPHLSLFFSVGSAFFDETLCSNLWG